MSAEKLREAARLMRERATHPDVSQSPWQASPHGDVHDDGSLWVCDSQSGETSEHIASWHPAVALAVADSLEEAADAFDRHMEKQMDPLRRFHGLWLAEAERKHERALAIARAYLGEDR